MRLWNTGTPDVKRRQAIVNVSLGGMAAMSAVSALQLGMVSHLPDPPIPGFNSDRVNTSKTAYPFGIPDGTLAFCGFAANIPLAAWGDSHRARKQPFIPIAAAAKALLEAIVAGWYFYQMPVREKAWCGYCIAGAVANVTIAALAMPEAIAAIRHGQWRRIL